MYIKSQLGSSGVDVFSAETEWRSCSVIVVKAIEELRSRSSERKELSLETSRNMVSSCQW